MALLPSLNMRASPDSLPGCAFSLPPSMVIASQNAAMQNGVSLRGVSAGQQVHAQGVAS